VNGTVEILSTTGINTASNLNITSVTHDSKIYDITIIGSDCFQVSGGYIT
jgi:hypothetical protein